MSYTKVCAYIPTTHGSTYCEIFTPVVSELISKEKGNTSPPTTILMVHGLGGSVSHWSESELPILLADQGHTVVCFDWYSHGKSTRLSSKIMTHNPDLFFSQLNDIIHCPQLPLLKARSFVAHGFSMGCYILLQYCIQYKPFGGLTECGGCNGSTPASTEVPVISKIILQSPWDGHFPFLLRGLLYVPGLLRLCKPSDMAEIKSIRTLKEILLWMDKGRDYSASLDAFADLVLHGVEQKEEARVVSPVGDGKASGSQSGASTQEVEVSVAVKPFACPLLLIVGTREPPFSINARRIARHIDKKQKGKEKGSVGSAMKEAAAASNAVPVVQVKYCKYADHMSFANSARGSYVRAYFQAHISDFVAGRVTTMK